MKSSSRVVRRDVDPSIMATACRRLEQELGCTSERAFDLLYGAASSQGGGLYELASVIAQATSIRPYISALEKFRR